AACVSGAPPVAQGPPASCVLLPVGRLLDFPASPSCRHPCTPPWGPRPENRGDGQAAAGDRVRPAPRRPPSLPAQHARLAKRAPKRPILAGPAAAGPAIGPLLFRKI